MGALYGLLIQPFVNVYKFFKVPGRLGKVKRLRMYTHASRFSLRQVAADAASCRCRRTSMPAGSAGPRRGLGVRRSRRHPRQGSREAGRSGDEGQVLAELRNIDIDMSIAELTGQREVLRGRNWRAGTHQLHRSAAPAEQIDQVDESLASVEEQLAKARIGSREAAACGTAGRHRVAAAFGRRPTADDRQLADTWSGSPLRTGESRRRCWSRHEVLPDRRSAIAWKPDW